MPFLPQSGPIYSREFEDDRGLDLDILVRVSALGLWQVIFQGCYQPEAVVVSYKDPM